MNHMHLGAVAASVACASTTLAGLGSVTTVFGPSISAGQSAPDGAVLGALADLTSFGDTNSATGDVAGAANVGQTHFFQIGGFYVGGAGPGNSAVAIGELTASLIPAPGAAGLAGLAAFAAVRPRRL
ncbi:MAG: hypothetical protein RLN60_02290 [Phycisphaerales bacterium]